MNNLVNNGISSTDRFVNIYHLKHNNTYRTLLFYQYVYLNNLSEKMKEKENILLSYLENDSGIKFVVIMSHDDEKKRYILKRVRFEMGIYEKINEYFDDKEPLIINDALLNTFKKILEEEVGWKKITKS